MKIQVLSDLHLDASNMGVDFNNADVVVIPGDLATNFKLALDFFYYNIPEHIPVIYVPGNHEYEGHKIELYDAVMKDKLKGLSNVFFLQNDEAVIDGVRFLGTTLWSDFKLYEPLVPQNEAMKIAVNNIADFSTIITEKRLFSPKDALSLFEESEKFLEYKLKRDCFDGETVVVSHFLPHKNSIAKKFNDDILNAYFCSDLEHLMGFSKLWLHGHTHDSVDYEVEGTKVLCNPRGYSRQYNLSSNHLFSDKLIIELENKPIKRFKF